MQFSCWVRRRSRGDRGQADRSGKKRIEGSIVDQCKVCHDCNPKAILAAKTEFIDEAGLSILRNSLKTRMAREITAGPLRVWRVMNLKSVDLFCITQEKARISHSDGKTANRALSSRESTEESARTEGGLDFQAVIPEASSDPRKLTEVVDGRP